MEYGRLVAMIAHLNQDQQTRNREAYLGGEALMSMLKVENLSVHYGMIQAVRDVSFEVNEGEVVF